MPGRPEVSVIVSNFERPANLLRCLHSMAVQEGVQGRFEVVVADDGSRDETPEVVEEFRRSASFPVRFTTHPHEGFRLARCRNEGILASSAEYLLFTDADCVFPRDHVQRHLRARRRNRVMAGLCCHLDAEVSGKVTVEMIRAGNLEPAVGPREARRVFLRSLRAWGHELVRRSMRPRLSGSNIGVWRADCERVNGFDENFVGWGLEDTDFQRRLESVGVRSKLVRSRIYHLWHPRDPTFARGSRGTPNYTYYHRSRRVPARCERGLRDHPAFASGGDPWPLPMVAADDHGSGDG